MLHRYLVGAFIYLADLAVAPDRLKMVDSSVGVKPAHKPVAAMHLDRVTGDVDSDPTLPSRRDRRTDESYGQRPRAFVVVRQGESLTEDDLKEHVRTHPARFKVPRRRRVPRGTSTKPDRFADWLGTTAPFVGRL